MMHKNHDFENILDTTPNFKLRQAVERLREGLFDPLGVKLLTTGEITLKQHFDTQTGNLQKGKSAHLCVCGAYGQGKSHTLNYIQQKGLENNYVVSSINLDPREVPFHNLKQVYRSIMENLTFPDQSGVGTIKVNSDSTDFVNIWKRSAKNWLSLSEKCDNLSLSPNRLEGRNSLVDMIPQSIPHRFKAILTAMAQQTVSISNGKRNAKKGLSVSNLKKNAGFKPREFPWILLNGFMGKEIPVTQLRNALKYRQVSFYNEESLVCRDPILYLEAIKGYGSLFQSMGYRGFIVLFDEAESIMLATVKNRSKSYSILDQILCPEISAKGFFPVFAFTDDFFTHLKNEDFERISLITKNKFLPLIEHTTNSPFELQESKKPNEVPIFQKNYSNEWKDINIYKLRNLTSKEWHDIITKLIDIHALAYSWQPDVDVMDKMIFSRLLKQSDAESRMKLKLIVDILDIEQQRAFI